MSEKQVLITERDGTYQLENEDFTNFELIGILECVLLDLKHDQRIQQAVVGNSGGEENSAATETSKSSETQSETRTENIPDAEAESTGGSAGELSGEVPTSSIEQSILSDSSSAASASVTASVLTTPAAEFADRVLGQEARIQVCRSARSW